MDRAELESLDNLPLVAELAGVVNLNGDTALGSLAQSLVQVLHGHGVWMFGRRGMCLDQLEFQRAGVYP
jgi:hypothetical protein